MFEKGDIVVVVITTPEDKDFPTLKKESRYVVNGGYTCCGRIYLDIGLRIRGGVQNRHCEHCGKSHGRHDIAYYDHAFFRKIEPSYKVVEVTENISEEIKNMVYN